MKNLYSSQGNREHHCSCRPHHAFSRTNSTALNSHLYIPYHRQRILEIFLLSEYICEAYMLQFEILGGFKYRVLLSFIFTMMLRILYILSGNSESLLIIKYSNTCVY
uniref:Uncharacterized protein n=1 Tax=Glossina austeni TaxID=7395 RepID=A0A1A9UZ52_GLOAU